MHGVASGAQLSGKRAHPLREALHVVEEHDFGHFSTSIIRPRRTLDLSRVKATTWSFTVQRVGPTSILNRDFVTGGDRR